MQVTAKLRNLRISPRKVRLVADLVRGKTVQEAEKVLSFTIKKAAPPLLKLLKSCLANAKNNLHLDPLNFYISKITVDQGQTYKRWQARARGQADPIQKKTSHITIVLSQLSKKARKAKKTKGPEDKKAAVVKTWEGKEKAEEKEDKKPAIVKPKAKPDLETKKPKVGRGLKRVFRRKAF